MPEKTEWPTRFIPDDKVTTALLAVVLGNLSLLLMESKGYMEMPLRVQKEAMEGLIYRSLRLKVLQPTELEILKAALYVAITTGFPDSELYMLSAMLEDECIPELMQRIYGEVDGDTADTTDTSSGQ